MKYYINTDDEIQAVVDAVPGELYATIFREDEGQEASLRYFEISRTSTDEVVAESQRETGSEVAIARRLSKWFADIR
tara:strand:- start:583 stop:813 length:231 start_codon:yes stop_codon:yes gene_type:complete